MLAKLVVHSTYTMTMYVVLLVFVAFALAASKDVTILTPTRMRIRELEQAVINCSTRDSVESLIYRPMVFSFVPDDDKSRVKNLSENTLVVDENTSKYHVTFINQEHEYVFMLTISDVTLSDSGLYICSRTTNATTQLIVTPNDLVTVHSLEPVELQEKIATTEVVECACPNGYMRYNKSCFRFYHQNLTWPESSYFCNVLDSKLIDSLTQDEFEFLRGYALENEDAFSTAWGFWVGGMSSILPGKYVWVSSRTEVSRDQLAGNGTVDDVGLCLHLGRQDNYYLSGHPCHARQNLICQAKLSGDCQ